MKILAVADEEEKILWDYYDPEKTKDVDLIISCGDLSPHYLEFLESMINVPLLYVHGNHDGVYEKTPPLGCTCIEDRVFDYYGLRMLGLGGSIRYKPGPCMYSESEMDRRINRMKRKINLRNGFDILVAHAPAKGHGDLADLPHNGFDCFNELLFKYRPRYMLHGHVHKAYGRIAPEILHPSGTKIINVCGYRILDIGEEEHPERGKTGSFLYDLYVSLMRTEFDR
ncbi:MAG: metallophosphoesterase family protein [Blautia sp.]|nr:metallophosphoesterase family protein [Blautia sp.]